MRDSDSEREERQVLARLALGLTSELPDPVDRAALAAAILASEVEDVYRPFGASYHNVTLPDMPAWIDPRIRLAEWAAIHRAGHDARAVALAKAAAAALESQPGGRYA